MSVVKKLLILSAAGVASLSATNAMAGGPDHLAMPPEPTFQPNIYFQVDVGYAHSDWRDFFGNVQFKDKFKKNIKCFWCNKQVVRWRRFNLVAAENRTGFFTVGGAIGYNFVRHAAIEFGAYYLPPTNFNFRFERNRNRDRDDWDWNGNNRDRDDNIRATRLTNWFLYLAARLDVPVTDNFDFYGKVGAAFRDQEFERFNDRFNRRDKDRDKDRDNDHKGLDAQDNDHNKGGDKDDRFNRRNQFFTRDGSFWVPMFAFGMKYSITRWFYVGLQYMHVSSNTDFREFFRTRRPEVAPPLDLITANIGFQFNL